LIVNDGEGFVGIEVRAGRCASKRGLEREAIRESTVAPRYSASTAFLGAIQSPGTAYAETIPDAAAAPIRKAATTLRLVVFRTAVGVVAARTQRSTDDAASRAHWLNEAIALK
jgi:hypothetical protein